MSRCGIFVIICAVAVFMENDLSAFAHAPYMLWTSNGVTHRHEYCTERPFDFFTGYFYMTYDKLDDKKHVAIGSKSEFQLHAGAVNETNGWQCYPCTANSSSDAILKVIGLCGDNFCADGKIPVKHAESRFYKRTVTNDKVLKKSGSVYVENHTSVEQKGKTDQFMTQVTKTFTYGFKEAISVKFTTKFKVEIVAEFGVEFNPSFEATQTWTSTESETKTFPSQDVKVPPHTKLRLTFNVYESEFIQEFRTNFTIDTDDELISNCMKKLNTYPLYRKLHLERSHRSGYKYRVGAILNSDTQKLLNVPAELKSYGLDTGIFIDGEEPLDSHHHAAKRAITDQDKAKNPTSRPSSIEPIDLSELKLSGNPNLIIVRN